MTPRNTEGQMFFQVETHGHQSQETDGESHIAGIIVDGSLWRKQSISKVCGEGLKKNILCCRRVWDLIVGTVVTETPSDLCFQGWVCKSMYRGRGCCRKVGG